MDIGWSELLVIGIVALIVVGPKDLPRMFAALGRFTAKARAMAREFQRAMDDAARESGASEVAKDIKAMTSKSGLGIDKLEAAAQKFERWDPTKPARPAPPAAAAESAPPPAPQPSPEAVVTPAPPAPPKPARKPRTSAAKPAAAATDAAAPKKAAVTRKPRTKAPDA